MILKKGEMRVISPLGDGFNSIPCQNDQRVEVPFQVESVRKVERSNKLSSCYCKICL